MEHFSHEHPLILKDVVLKDHHEAEIMCKCCQKSISHEEDEQAYGCNKCSEDYFLHKECAELPREILYPKHTQHSLVLFSESPYSGESINCNECGKRNTGFTYHCSLCLFDLHTSCALKDNYTSSFVDRGIKHDSHKHSLVFQIRPALFRCDACGVEDKDQFYQCLSCPFYIHKSCASSPTTGNREDHSHPLTLAYNLPSDYHNFRFDCGVCSMRILKQYWVYYCRLCRYFVHLKCMTSKTKEQIEDNSEYDVLDDSNFEEKLLKVLLDDDLLQLPSTNLSEKMIKRFLLRKNKLSQIQPEIRHECHKEHPLVLITHDQQNLNGNEIEEDEQIMCNCCIEPVSAPYYSCVQCSYFLHLPCANLPKKLQHSSHPHPLKLYASPTFYKIFACKMCELPTNGLLYVCFTCNFGLDVKCAALPNVIEHQQHRHPLFQFRALLEDQYKCNGCFYTISGSAFGCESCEFYVHLRCAMLPRAIKHRWAKHPFPLRFPPHSDHPYAFMCDICEKDEINPKLWLYYSTDCDISFHPRCVPRLKLFPHVKFGAVVEVSSHSHPLKFLPEATLKSFCDDCGKDIKGFTVFECEECNFCICRPCVDKSIL